MKTILLALVALGAAGCAGSDSSTTTGSSSSASYHCCVNGSYYTCPSADAVSKCVNDTSACDRDSSKDNTCSQ